jgi:predicted RNA binding protein YcfA (HicA-like mRNA interferase family)
LEQHLQKHGCHFDRHGASHDIWLNPSLLKETVVPRHREIPTGTARAICKQLGVPNPAGK